MQRIMLEVPEAQIVRWVRQLSPVARRDVLRILVPRLDEVESLVDYGEQRIRELSAQRGLDWDHLPKINASNWLTRCFARHLVVVLTLFCQFVSGSSMNKSVYLDATIPSYLFDDRESIREYIAVTKYGGARRASTSTSTYLKKRSPS